jgi:PAS domain S-box-containing protein
MPARGWDRASALAQAIVETSPFAVMAFDLEGRIILWSRGAERLLGRRAAEVLGHAFPAESIPLDELEDSRERIGRMLDGAVIQGERVRRYARDGRQLALEIHGTVIRDRAGQAIGHASQMVPVCGST